MFKHLFNRRRSEPRRNFDIGTTARIGDGVEVPVRIVSLSARGFRLKGCQAAQEDAQVAIILPGYGQVFGRVVWTAGDECGGILQSPIPIADIDLTETAA